VCWCYVAGLSVGDMVSECRLNHYSAICSNKEREKEGQVGFRCHEMCGVNQKTFYF